MFLFVFIGKKLISTDSILPIIVELKTQNPKLKCFLISPDKKTHNNIIDNKTLISCIRKYCIFLRLGGLHKSTIIAFYQKILWFVLLCVFSALIRSNLAKAIHFGNLEENPRNIFLRKSGKNIYFFENNSWGTGKYEYSVDYITKAIPKSSLIKCSGNLVCFSEDWKIATDEENKHLSIHKITPAKLWPAWNTYLSETRPIEWLNECHRLGINQDQKVVVFILGTLDGLPSLGMGVGPIDNIVIKTLDAIHKALPDTPIILKPHAITSITRLKKILKLATPSSVHISYVHPAIIAPFCVAGISNYFSTAQIDLWYHNVPTIEYTKYSLEGLKITHGGSMRPEYVDYFLEINQPEVLITVLRKVYKYQNEKSNASRMNPTLSKEDKKIVSLLSS